MTSPPAGPRRRVFHSDTESDTGRLGAAFGVALQPAAGRALRVWLSGDLGAGKTTFVRGLLRHFGVSGAVRSPTYSLIEHYALGPLEVVHGDLYRLERPDAVTALALDEFDRPGTLWLIEWPERGEGVLPSPDLWLGFIVEAQGHRIDVTALSEAGADWLARVAGSTPLKVAGHDA